jgi:hypothetical protein
MRRYQINCFNKLHEIGHEDLKPGQKLKLKNKSNRSEPYPQDDVSEATRNNTIFVTGTPLAPSAVENCNLRKELKQTILKNLPHPTDLPYYLLTSLPVMRIEMGEIFKPNWLMDLSNTPAVSFSLPDLGPVSAYPMIFSVSILGQFRYFYVEDAVSEFACVPSAARSEVYQFHWRYLLHIRREFYRLMCRLLSITFR